MHETCDLEKCHPERQRRVWLSISHTPITRFFVAPLLRMTRGRNRKFPSPSDHQRVQSGNRISDSVSLHPRYDCNVLNDSNGWNYLLEPERAAALSGIGATDESPGSRIDDNCVSAAKALRIPADDLVAATPQFFFDVGGELRL